MFVRRPHCICLPGWTGQDCGTEIDACDSSPCQQGATCWSHEGSFNCSCPSGYEGNLPLDTQTSAPPPGSPTPPSRILDTSGPGCPLIIACLHTSLHAQFNTSLLCPPTLQVQHVTKTWMSADQAPAKTPDPASIVPEASVAYALWDTQDQSAK